MGLIHLLKSKESYIDKLSVKRVLPSMKQKMVGPWIFFDHIGPINFQENEGIDILEHPHIGLATVTYLFEGEILHQDSLGTTQIVYAGDVNLMISGKGITHSERETPHTRQTNHSLHGIQLWYALPDFAEDIDPEFYHYPKPQIPYIQKDGLRIKVIIGKAYGVCSPVKTYTNTLYLDIHSDHSQSLQLPNTPQMGIYLITGDIQIQSDDNTTHLAPHDMATFESSAITVIAQKDSHYMVIGGDVMEKKYIEWNFVSSSKQKIELAKQIWLNNKFPKIP